MRIIVYDIEVFEYDWFVIFYDTSSNEWTVVHNDNDRVRRYMEQPNVIFAGFNNKGYDNHIVKAIACGADNLLVKEINDFIIKEDRSGWEHWFLRKNKFWFESFDLMDDTQTGTSLKHIEAHMGWNIEETEVDFDIPRPLTPEEIASTIHYCKWDVMATAKLLTLRKGYLEAKINVARTKNIPDSKALYMTNARLTAEFLGAKLVKRFDERDYEYPRNLRRDLIPDEVIRFFDQLRDPEIPSEALFNSKLKIDVDGAEAVIGFGGIHHARLNYREERNPRARRVIRNFDVASLYPSLMVNNGYTSRNIPSPETFKGVYETRLKAKQTGDKHTANTLKLILNTTYGASLATTNPLYDALMGRSVCITGQLYILELAMQYLRHCDTVRIIQLNTDGLMISLEERELPIIYELNDAWQASKNLILEEDKIAAIYQKDVNNYVAVYENGKVKTKGAYATFGIAPAGAFSINNNHVIVKEALIEYLVNGTPVEQTIYRCTDIHKFQIIAKAGQGYKDVYRVPYDFEDYKKQWQKENKVLVKEELTWGEGNGYDPYKPPTKRRTYKQLPFRWGNYDGYRESVQKVNRVYAAKNPYLGYLVKIKPDGSIGRIGGLPDSCVIDNKNELTLDQIDIQWYINLAKKYVEDYTGES